MASVGHPHFRSRRRSSTTLSATDEFWFSPTLADVMPPSCDCDHAGTPETTAGGDDHDADALLMVAMPPAHAQLLVDEGASSTPLAGYDHTLRDAGHADADGPAWRPKLSAVKRQGGGSWLLGSFARLAAEAETSAPAPGLPRVPSGASLASDEDASAASADALPATARGVSFAPSVTVRPIPHAVDLSGSQRLRMYASAAEVRANKLRNKVEFRHDGFNWRAAAEEWEMGVDMVTGELIHPAHEYGL